ncbi:MAG: glycosyltransferase family 4 protein [Candidatus Diapherotrites archaeon]|uniref:Glycosyltransferase family 4 protein n=1 Tax=Candidatus Iainarchaeum sp. TaxID=3101447 RepID=A0A939C6G8_9ARCH|nr:glycosyltransferase family 4 protein [Candidatus Diapherotrites archaeon]
MELDGVSIQGEMLYQGLLHNKHEARCCDREAVAEKELLYKSFKPDVVIGVGYWGDTPTLIQDPLHHGMTPVPWLNADGWVANYHDILNKLPLIMVTSNWVKHTYKRDGVTNRNIEVMPIGIDMQEMRPLPKNDVRIEQVKKMLRIKPGQKIILTAGGDTTSKGFQEVLKALGKIDKDFPDWVYVGKSWESRTPYYHYKDELKLMKELGIRRKVRFLDGPLSRDFMCCLLNACDVYAAPSRIDGFGMIQVEAQACGRPVLGVDSMGIKDTVLHGKTGFLAKVGEEVKLAEEWVYKWQGFKKKHKIKFDEPKTFGIRADVDDLADYLYKMLSDDELREKMGENGRDYVVENFDYVKTSERAYSLIEKKLGLNGRERATVSVKTR